LFLGSGKAFFPAKPAGAARRAVCTDAAVLCFALELGKNAKLTESLLEVFQEGGLECGYFL
jgi:hypothetical protein